MSLISRITTAPIAYEEDRAKDILQLYPDAPENVKALLTGTAGCSPYLRGILEREADWLQSLWNDSTESILGDIRTAVTGSSFDALATDLRQAKRRTALLVALADLGGVWTLSQVTNALTRFADFAVQKSLELLVGAEIARGKLPGCDEADIPDAAGMTVLAMGKMGAFELNYSSDIDLIVLFDETRHKADDFENVRAAFIRITKRLCKMLSDVTRDGYVFRTDLRLRPDPSVTPVCLSMEAAERYYESLGRTWERAAFIKARPCAGDIKAGRNFLSNLRPFIWRKHLDFAAIEDAHDMRLRIREHKGLGGPITLPGHNMKLGRGGIREIEFFTQTRQIIAGGRDPELREAGTLDGMERLAEKGWISDVVAASLSDAYVDHRTIEHRLQMLGDAQTHDLPNRDDQFDRLARFCGKADTGAFQAGIGASLELVHNLTESFFTQDAGTKEAAPELALSDTAKEIIDKWRLLPAFRSRRAGDIFKRLQPIILARLQRASDPAEALIQFDGFLAGLPSGVQLFALFEANPQLIDLLVDICATAPGLSRYLSRNSDVFDAVIGGSFFQPLPGPENLKTSLSEVLDGITDYETQLNSTRRWMKEQHFRIGVHLLQGMIAADRAATHYSDLATACVCCLFDPVCAAFAVRHGPAPGRGAMVLGMGSLGAGSISASSDLDMIVIYDADGQEASTGKRPLAVSAYYARLTQSLVTALSSPMAEGRLYEVDMRLRPSGRKGPVATALSGFKSYQSNEAWTWEHLALTRARGVAGSPDLVDEVEGFRRSLLKKEKEENTVLGDTANMRARIAAAAGSETMANPLETKSGPGRMLDIELIAQAGALVAGEPGCGVIPQLECCSVVGWCTVEDVNTLIQNYAFLQIIQQIGRILSNEGLDAAAMGLGGCEVLLKATGEGTIEALVLKLKSSQTASAAIIDKILGRFEI